MEDPSLAQPSSASANEQNSHSHSHSDFNSPDSNSDFNFNSDSDSELFPALEHLSAMTPSRRQLRYQRMRPFVPYVDTGKNAEHDGHGGLTCLVRPDDKWVDLGMIRGWLRACEEGHGLCRAREQGRPAWLIDVWGECLVPVPVSVGAEAETEYEYEYIALSYVWGEDEVGDSGVLRTCALRGNVEALQKRGALAGAGPVVMPRTVWQVAQLVRRLGKRYLWVDRFCIIQDSDAAVKQAQLDAMGEIYAGATAVMVAAGAGNADGGLEGIPGVSSRRFLSARLSNIISAGATGFTRQDLLLSQAADLMRTAWFSRGWTFQEYIFSRRRIIFHNGTVNWECVCSAWAEVESTRVTATATALPVDAAPQQGDPPSKNTADWPPWPDLRRFARLVSLYNRRILTYPEDALDAFAGVISRISPSFDGGFITGLPQAFFDSALLWQPYRPMSRRIAKRLDPNQACLPSWSWVGWHGSIHSESWRSGYGYMRKNPDEYLDHDPTVWQKTSWQTYSTVNWFLVDDSETPSHRKPVHVSGHRYGKSPLEVPPPAGWAQHRCAIDGEAYFRHECDPSQTFWYPIPIPLVYPSPLPGEASAPAPSSIRVRHLWCRTRRAILRLGKPFANSFTSQCYCVDLLDSHGQWIGALRSPFRWILNSLEKGEQEVIELSRGSVENQETEKVSIDEWFREGCPRKRGSYEFYNVMAIEWDGQVAYRQAVGRVVKSAWEQLVTEDIELTLG